MGNFFTVPNCFTDYTDPKTLLEAVKRKGGELKYASSELKNNPEIVLEAVKNDGFALKYASEELRNDREIVLEAVKRRVSSLEYASEELRNDKEFILEAVKQDGFALEYVSEELRNDREFILEAVKRRVSSLEYASEELRNDKEFILEAVKQDGFAFEYVSEEFRNDKEIVLEAVKRNGWALKYAREEFRNDKEIVLEAVKRRVSSLKYASEELRNDKEIILEAVKQDVEDALEYASEELRNDKEIILEAVKQDVEALQYASEELKNDREFVLGAVKRNGSALLQYASEKLRNDIEFLLEAVTFSGSSVEYTFKYARDRFELENDREFLLEAVKFSGSFVKFASDELKNDREFLLEAVKRNGLLLEQLDGDWRDDFEVVQQAVKQNGLSLKFASERLKNDASIVKSALLYSLQTKNFGTIFQCLQNVGSGVIDSSRLLRYILQRGGGDLLSVLERNVFKDDEWDAFFRRQIFNNGNNLSLDSVDLQFEDEEVVGNESMLSLQKLENQFRKVSFSQLSIIRKLGRGCYGSTYQCTVNIEDDDKNKKKKKKKKEGEKLEGFYVVKIYNDPSVTKEKKKELLQGDALYLPYHPNVVPILSHREKEVICVERLPDFEDIWKHKVASGNMIGGMVLMNYHRMNLSEFIKNKKHFKSMLQKSEIGRILYGIIKGSTHLNFNCVIHRDLHPDNIFIYPNLGRIWIGDFGCALDLRKNRIRAPNRTAYEVRMDDEIMFSMCSYGFSFREGGYSKFLAPEVRKAVENKDEYVDYTKSDLYSVGLTGKILLNFYHQQQQNGERFLEMVEFVDLISNEDKDKRIDFFEANLKIDRICRRCRL